MAIQKGDKNNLVKKWQEFLVKQNLLTATPNGEFGPKTEQATIAFQKLHNITPAKGIVGSVTIGVANSLGFNPDNEPAPVVLTGDKKLAKWIKDNLGAIIKDAVKNTKYTEEWLAAMCMRETGFLIVRYTSKNYSFKEICENMRGDYRYNSRLKQKVYNGYGFWQIDINTDENFVNSDNWKDPKKCIAKAISVLNEKRAYLTNNGAWNERLSETEFNRAITAAYNCGQGNVFKALNNNKDVDYYTFNKDYSAEVFRYMNVYKSV